MASATPLKQNKSVRSELANDVGCSISSGRNITQQFTDENSNFSVNIIGNTTEPERPHTNTPSVLCRSSKTEGLSNMNNPNNCSSVVKRTRALAPFYKTQEPGEGARLPCGTPRKFSFDAETLTPKYLRHRSDAQLALGMSLDSTLCASGSDHVTLLPLTRPSAHRRHTFPSLQLPTITVCEADDSGPQSPTNPNDFSEANLNLLLPVEVSVALYRSNARSLPSSKSTFSQPFFKRNVSMR